MNWLIQEKIFIYFYNKYWAYELYAFYKMWCK